MWTSISRKIRSSVRRLKHATAQLHNRMIRADLLDGGVLCSGKHFPGARGTDTVPIWLPACVDKSIRRSWADWGYLPSG